MQTNNSPVIAPVVADFAATLITRYRDLAILDAGDGELLHEGMSEGASDDYFEANTGGGIWISHSLHEIEGVRLHASAGSDTVMVYIAQGDTAAAAAEVIAQLCGDDAHLVVAEDEYHYGDSPTECETFLLAIYERFLTSSGLPRLDAEEMLITDRPSAYQRRWLTAFTRTWEKDVSGPARPVLPGAPDRFTEHLGAACNSMLQDDSRGEVLGMARADGFLQVSRLSGDQIAALTPEEATAYEIVIFDGGNSAGDSWKHIFFPSLQVDYFVRDPAN